MSARRSTLQVLEGKFAVCRLGPGDAVPAGLFESAFVSLTRTPDEISIVCSEGEAPPDTRCETGWRRIRVRGSLDLAETGVLAALATPLAEARISAFALSTFDTDYLLVKESDLSAALSALAQSGHRILE
jgi:hypothetical protein